MSRCLSQSRAFPFDQMPVEAFGEWRGERDVVRGVLPTGEAVSMHESMQPAGADAASCAYDPALGVDVVREGTLEFDHDGKMEQVGPGGVLYVALGTMHGLKNVGDGPAKYFVVAIGGDVRKYAGSASDGVAMSGMKNLNRRDFFVCACRLLRRWVVWRDGQAACRTSVLSTFGGVFLSMSCRCRRSANGGESRAVMQGVLATGEAVEVHETTLPPGQMPHPPHKHRHSEFHDDREGLAGVRQRWEEGEGGAGWGDLCGFGRDAWVEECGGCAGELFCDCDWEGIGVRCRFNGVVSGEVWLWYLVW